MPDTMQQIADNVSSGRRLRIAYISPEMVLQVLGRRPTARHGGEDHWILYHLDGMPDDAKIVGVNFDHTRHAFALAVEHSDFDVVPPVECCPELTLYVSVTRVPVTPVTAPAGS